MDINILRERKTPSELTVSELNNYIKTLISGDRALSAISVRGEISNLTRHRSGHLYFTLKDEGSKIPAVMFHSAASGLRFLPENGMKVIVRCSVSVYVPTGSYQLYVNSMQPDGIGALYLSYEQLKARLAEEGLFDKSHKLPIPFMPSKIGVITSPTGAAVRDIINILGRRFPMATVYVYPSLVQGEYAEADLIKALDYFEQSRLADVIIIGRGGGSIEDLWAFNGESLARKIYSCTVPVISAVGHETDFTICDFVADLRATTPSAAAELAVPDKNELLLRLDGTLDRCAELLMRALERLEDKYKRLLESSALAEPERLFEEKADALRELFERVAELTSGRLDDGLVRLRILAGKLDTLSPLSVLARGYGVISKDGKSVKGVDDLNENDIIDIRLGDGDVRAKVFEKRKNDG